MSDTTLRARRDEWIAAGVFEQLKDEALAAFDRIIGLDLDDVALDGSLHKAPDGGEGTGPLRTSAPRTPTSLSHKSRARNTRQRHACRRAPVTAKPTNQKAALATSHQTSALVQGSDGDVRAASSCMLAPFSHDPTFALVDADEKSSWMGP